MGYKKSFSVENNIVTDVEILSFSQVSLSNNIDMFTYDIVKDPSNIVSISDVKAMWDTGADISCINTKLATDLKLPLLGSINVRMANDISEECDRVLAAIKLNDIMGILIPFASFSFDAEYDMIIGRDIISQGKLIIDYLSDTPTLEFINSSISKEVSLGNIVSIIKRI